jgi:hypothetical protein
MSVFEMLRIFWQKASGRDLTLQRELLKIGRMITDLRKNRASNSVEPIRKAKRQIAKKLS